MARNILMDLWPVDAGALKNFSNDWIIREKKCNFTATNIASLNNNGIRVCMCSDTNIYANISGYKRSIVPLKINFGIFVIF